MQTTPNNIEQIIEEFTIKTKRHLGSHLKQMILYGSYARGDFNENIDKFNYWLDTIPFYMNVQKEGVHLSGY